MLETAIQTQYSAAEVFVSSQLSQAINNNQRSLTDNFEF